MKDTPQKGRSILKREWFITIVVFLGLLLLFSVFDHFSWSPFNNIQEGGFVDRLSNSKLFTEWFAPFKFNEFNLFTAFFAMTLLPTAFICAIKDIKSRK